MAVMADIGAACLSTNDFGEVDFVFLCFGRGVLSMCASVTRPAVEVVLLFKQVCLRLETGYVLPLESMNTCPGCRVLDFALVLPIMVLTVVTFVPELRRCSCLLAAHEV